VFTMRRLPESRIPVIAPDNHRGAWLATAHLIGKGHRRLAFFGGSSDLVVYHERLGGFREACEALGIAKRDTLVVEGETALAMADPPTAALCFNDAVAFGVMLALRKRGLEPGADFAVVGFDDVIEAQHYMPALTSVAVDSAGLGERAAHVMLKMIQSRTTRAEDHIGAVNLVVRDSCGPDRRTGMGDAA
ncbi:MAG: LacI family transcriptional regulator, partial [Mesorhizobium sp.]